MNPRRTLDFDTASAKFSCTPVVLLPAFGFLVVLARVVSADPGVLRSPPWFRARIVA